MPNPKRILKILEDQVRSGVISPEQADVVKKSIKVPEELVDDRGTVFSHEYFNPVSDYIGKRKTNERVSATHDYAFDKAASDVDAVKQMLTEEIMEALGTDKIPKHIQLEPKFAEFDSPNPSHANARFDVQIKGMSPSDIQRFRSYWGYDED